MFCAMQLHKIGLSAIRLCQFSTVLRSSPPPVALRHRIRIIYCDRGFMHSFATSKYATSEEEVSVIKLNLPSIQSPHEVIIEVKASSVNPIDIKMLSGYGSSIFNALRQFDGSPEFPFITGRDFSGIVAWKGSLVKHVDIGDEVWGCVDVHRQGAHSQFVRTSAKAVRKKPVNLTHTEAAAIPFTALTVWSALRTIGRINIFPSKSQKNRALIIGASGGLGVIAVQLLNGWGYSVTAVCQEDAFDLAKELGADHCMDYKSPSFSSDLSKVEKFDVVLNTVEDNSRVYQSALKPWNCSSYISVYAALQNFDNYGVVVGAASTFSYGVWNMITGFPTGSNHRAGFYIPNGSALDELRALVDNEKLKPIVQKVYPFQNIHQAFKDLAAGHTRGKIVIDFSDSDRPAL